MAGRGSRFLKQGYNQPKFMIEVKGKTLFQWSMNSLDNFSANASWHFVTLKGHEASAFIGQQCSKLGIKEYSVTELTDLTSGQAESAIAAFDKCDLNAPCLIYNIDTHVSPEALLPEDIKGEGWVPCFDMPGDHWSFVKLGPDGCAVEVREKKRISNMCSIGLYWFATPHLFLDAYNSIYVEGAQLEAGETYIAPLYNQLIDDGRCVSASMIPADAVIPLGTPEEVSLFTKAP